MSKKLNIIEAMKMPIGTEFEVEFDGKKIPNNTMKIYRSLEIGRQTKIIDWKCHPEDIFMKPYDFLINGVFIPIQQPVSFIEAINNANNRIRVDLDGLKFTGKATIDLNKYMKISKMFETIRMHLSDYGISKAIKEGKWYIEESEELEDERLS